MPFDLDVQDADWRAELSHEQLDALEKRGHREVEPVAPVMVVTAPRVAVRLVGADRGRLKRGGDGRR